MINLSIASISFNSHIQILTKPNPGAEEMCHQGSQAPERIEITGRARNGNNNFKINFLEIWHKTAPCRLNTKNSKAKALATKIKCLPITLKVVINGKMNNFTVGCKAVFNH